MRTRDEALKFFNDNIALAYFARCRYGRIFDGFRGLAPEDIDQICMLGLWTAALRFDPARELKFSTYAVSSVRGALRKAYRAQARQCGPGALPLGSASTDPPGGAGTSGFIISGPENTAEEACARADCDAFVRSLPERSRLVLACRLSGMSQAETGHAVGLSQVHVSRVIRSLARRYESER